MKTPYRPHKEVEFHSILDGSPKTRQEPEETLQIVEQVLERYKALQIPEADAKATPLTAEEAEAIEHEIDALLERINTTKQKVQHVRNAVLTTVNKYASGSLDVDISDRPLVQDAVERVFGFRTTVITQSMYTQLIDKKRAMEQSEVESYTKGDW